MYNHIPYIYRHTPYRPPPLHQGLGSGVLRVTGLGSRVTWVTGQVSGSRVTLVTGSLGHPGRLPHPSVSPMVSGHQTHQVTRVTWLGSLVTRPPSPPDHLGHWSLGLRSLVSDLRPTTTQTLVSGHWSPGSLVSRVIWLGSLVSDPVSPLMNPRPYTHQYPVLKIIELQVPVLTHNSNCGLV
jgi:hypothetical protein